MYCKIISVQKLRSLTGIEQGVSGQKYSKLCALSTCWSSRTRNGQLVATCFVPKGTRQIFIDLVLVVSMDSLQLFSTWITVPRVARLEA